MHAERAIGGSLHGSLARACRVMASVRHPHNSFTMRRTLYLAECSEAEVVKFFGGGLQAFISSLDGRFEARNVSLFDEATWPSDQDYAVLFQNDSGFSLHLFGLQFKRWNRSHWPLKVKQNDTMRRMGHVLAYAFPRPIEASAPNMLHAFTMIHPNAIPTSSNQLHLANDEFTQNVIAKRVNDKDGEEELGTVQYVSWGQFFEAVQKGAISVAVPSGGGPFQPSGGSGPGGPGGGFGLRFTTRGQWGERQLMNEMNDHLSFWGRTYLDGEFGIIAFESFSRSMLFLEVTAT